ncbi:MAG: leucine-rich repeat domain-containing protein [Clostridia bacterium]|nr:leucine-rich repeat domain-containing protein [Clostridia bacterium]
MKSLKIKKVLFIMLTLTAVFMLFSVTAYADEYGNFSYNSIEPEEGEEFEPYIEISGYSSDDNEEPVAVQIPDVIDDVPVTAISASAFSGVSNLKEVIIPDTVTTIENAAFYDCHDLEIVVIPDSVTYIGESAFQSCENLKYVIIGNGVKLIGDIAFKDCVALEVVSIGSAVETIGNGAFYNCTALTDVRIPASVKEIEKLAFGYYQNGSEDAVVDGFTFYTDGANAAVNAYGATADVEDSSEDVSAPVAGALAVINNSACAEHSVKYTNVRTATDSYDGLDVAFCADCASVVTQPNYDMEPEESSSSLITFIIIAVLVVAFVILLVWYVKMSKKRRDASIAAYNAGKPLPDVAEKEAQEKKEAEKYAKKKAKQEANLRKYIDF